MPKRKTEHTMRFSIILFVIIFVSACGKINTKIENTIVKTKHVVAEKSDLIDNKIINEIKEPITSEVSLFKKFPKLENEIFGISQQEGLYCEYLPFFYKYYFKYKGNKDSILDFISKIECNYTEITPDSTFKEIEYCDFENTVRNITNKEKIKAAFFFEYKESDIGNLEFFDCIKTPEHHYIIFNKETGIIYHMIESFRE